MARRFEHWRSWPRWACATAVGAPEAKDAKPGVTVDGLIDGKPVEVDPKAAGPAADAAVKVVAGSGVTDYLDDRARPLGKDFWDQWVTRGIENGRAHLRVRFAKPREVEGTVNQQKAKFAVSEVVLFDPGAKGPDPFGRGRGQVLLRQRDRWARGPGQVARPGAGAIAAEPGAAADRRRQIGSGG